MPEGYWKRFTLCWGIILSSLAFIVWWNITLPA